MKNPILRSTKAVCLLY